MDEVCGFTGVKPYVLRFWESEFPEISPITSASGQKLYGHKDIEAVALIKKLLFDEKLSIEKAKLRMLETYKERAEDTGIQAKEEISGGGLQFRRGLSENDVEKLVYAKQKIEKLVTMANTIKERHYWS